LGLILNEMFTGDVPHGTQYRLIESVSKQHAFLDPIVERMLSQRPEGRPQTIAEIKLLIQRYESDAVSLQRISKIDDAVIKSDTIDEPLAFEPPQLVGIDWWDGRLILTLDRPVTQDWIVAFHRIGLPGAPLSVDRQKFAFDINRKVLSVGAMGRNVQLVLDAFKACLPRVTQELKILLEQRTRKEEAQNQSRLREEREKEQQRLNVLKNLRI
jgi:hypothetical protein